MLEQLLADLAGEYPAFGEVFLDERDVFLTHSLQAAAQSVLTPECKFKIVCMYVYTIIFFCFKTSIIIKYFVFKKYL